jgi:hypothetical protein
MSSQQYSPSRETSRSSKESYRDILSDQDDDSESTEDEMASIKQRLMRDDVEAQPTLCVSTDTNSSTSVALEYRIPASRKLAYLALYFLLNLSLTIYNKAVLGAVSRSIVQLQSPTDNHHQQFAYPWLLTALHATCSSVGCFAMYSNGVFNLTRLNAKEQMVLFAFSFLFTLNIAMSNVSL